MELLDAIGLALEHVGGERHENYNRTVEIRKKNTAYATGEGMEDYIRPNFPNVTEDELQKIIQLTHPITPSLWNKIEKPFDKALRSEITSRYEADDAFKEEIATYYGGRPLRYFMDTIWKKTYLLDPNAFLLVDWETVDNTTDKNEPYPVIIPADYIYNFKIENDDLKWVLVHNHVANDKTWTWYSDGLAIQLTLRDQDKVNEDAILTSELPVDLQKDAQRYDIVVIDTALEKVNMKRVGTILDPFTNYETCVSPVNPAIPTLDKTIKAGAEIDFAFNRYVFPRYRYFAEECEGYQDEPCIKGCDTAGNTCKACGGTQKKRIMTSSKDVIEYSLKKEIGETQGEPYDLSKMYDQEPFDGSLIKTMLENMEALKADAIKDVFNTTVYETSSVQKTATEYNGDSEAISDALHPFTMAYSEAVKWQIRTIADSRDDKVENIVFQFPADLRLETMADLIGERSALEGSPSFILQDKDRRIAERMYKDSPDELEKFTVKLKYEPFAGKSEATIKYLISTEKVSDEDINLWVNYDKVWLDLEEKYPEGFKKDNIREILYELAEAYMIDDPEIEAVPELGAGVAAPAAGGDTAPQGGGSTYVSTSGDTSVSGQLTDLFNQFQAGTINEDTFYTQATKVSGLSKVELQQIVNGG